MQVSEGIDFSNDKGRAVVITGLPFPPTKDPKIVLKKSILDSAVVVPGELVRCLEFAIEVRLRLTLILDLSPEIDWKRVVHSTSIASREPSHRSCHSSPPRLRGYHTVGCEVCIETTAGVLVKVVATLLPCIQRIRYVQYFVG